MQDGYTSSMKLANLLIDPFANELVHHFKQ